MSILPVLVFDTPDNAGVGLPEQDMTTFRLHIKGLHPLISFVQLILPGSYRYAMHCLSDCVRTVFPKPDRSAHRATFVSDMIMFLEAFRSLAQCILVDPTVFSAAEILRTLKKKTVALRLLEDPREVSFFLLEAISASFERSILFSVEDSGLSVKKVLLPARKEELMQNLNQFFSVPLRKYSVFDDVIDAGQLFYGESDDEVLHHHLFQKIGEPHARTVFILPLKVSGQVRALVYADFGDKEASSVFTDAYEVLAIEAGVILENARYRQQILKSTNKQ
jgi:hypothetical protein